MRDSTKKQPFYCMTCKMTTTHDKCVCQRCGVPKTTNNTIKIVVQDTSIQYNAIMA